MALHITLTGSMSVEAGGVPIEGPELRGRQARVLLALLVLERGRAVPRSELADVLWPERLPPTWEPALRGVLSKVRGVLVEAGLPAAEVLTVAFGCYQLHLPRDAEVDLESAFTAVEAAELALRNGAAEEAFRKALAARATLGRPFLAGEEGFWVERIREDMRARRLRALETLSAAAASRGRCELAVEAAEEAVSLEPLRESAHRRLMAAHATSGNLAKALRAYERCRLLLADELGVRPSLETEAAYTQLLGQEPATDMPSEESSEPLALPRTIQRATSFVGRRSELAELQEAWDEVKAGCGQVVLVGAEAGMGKTALAAEMVVSAHSEGATILHGRCDKPALLPYQALSEALSRYIADCPLPRLLQQVGDAGAGLALLAPDVRQRLPELPARAGDSDTDRHQLFVAISGFVARIAQEKPVVLLIDDLQWARSPLLLLVRYLIWSLPSAPVLIVITYRDDEIGANTEASEALRDLRTTGCVHHMQLGGLDEDDVGALISQVQHIEPGTWTRSLARRLWDDTGGNVLFVRELLRHVLESDASPDRDGSRDDPLAKVELSIPSTVSEVILRRASLLSKDALRALGVASVVGKDFDFDLVEQVSGLDTDVLLDAMEEAEEARLICEVNGTAGHYQFAHGLLRDVVYGQLRSTRRARLHLGVGEALRGRGGDAGPHLATVAHHFWKAGAAADPEEVVEYVMRAGRQALDELAYEQAATHFERALEIALGAGQESRRCEILMALAMAQRKAGQVAVAREAYLQAAELARHHSDPEALASCALGLATESQAVSAWMPDEVRISLLEEALEALGDGDTELRVKVSAELARTLHFCAPDRRSEELARQAIEAARRISSPSVLASALLASRVVSEGPRNTELRLTSTEEIVALAEEAHDLELSVRARLARLADLFEFGEQRAVDEEIDVILSLASHSRQPYYVWQAASWNALRTIVTGRLDDAERLVQQGLELWRGDENADGRNCAKVQLATLDVLCGRPEKPEATIRALAETYERVPSFHCFLAYLLALQGRRSEAASEFEGFAADGFVTPPFDANWLFGIGALAETCALLGDSARAEVLSALLLPYAGRMVVLDAFGAGASYWGSVSHHLGILAATMGRTKEAADHLQAAVEANRRFGGDLWTQRSQLALAHVTSTDGPYRPTSFRPVPGSARTERLRTSVGPGASAARSR